MITAAEMRRRLPGDVGFLPRRGRAWRWRSRHGRLVAEVGQQPLPLPSSQAARLVELRAGAPA